MAINIIDKDLKFNSNHSTRNGKPKAVVLHHAAASSASVETIHSWHLGNGWAGIGYHFYVRKDGKIYRGRPESWNGGHTYGYNEYLGICAEGNFENEKMPAAQKTAIIELLRYLFDKYGEIKVYKHRDLDATACPGKNYPFDSIVSESKKAVTTTKPQAKPQTKRNLVQEFQTAAIADGLAMNVYGADGIWGAETSKAATALVKEGSVGCRVKLIQELVGVSVDGIFGAKTKAAVKAYQSKKGLAVDGIVGLNTWRKLLGV